MGDSARSLLKTSDLKLNRYNGQKVGSLMKLRHMTVKDRHSGVNHSAVRHSAHRLVVKMDASWPLTNCNI
jgi:hypothetical protein